MSNRSTTAAIARASRALQQRNHRVTRYRDLVIPIAIHYCRRCPEPLEDLVQVGLLGLLRAAELYQASLATPFEAFARPHVRGAILHYLRDTSPMVRLPRRQMELQERLRQLRSRWAVKEGGEATDEQLRCALGITPKQWQELQRGQALSRPMRLDADDGLDERFHAMRGDPSSAVTEADGVPLELLNRLDPALQQVVRKVVLAGWSYRRTAALLQVSPMTVQRRLRRGLRLLQQGLLVGGERTPSRPDRLNRCRRLHHAASVVPAC